MVVPDVAPILLMMGLDFRSGSAVMNVDQTCRLAFLTPPFGFAGCSIWRRRAGEVVTTDLDI